LQVFCTLLSFDGENLPEVPALIGATTAIKLAGITCKTLVGARLALSDQNWLINPTFSSASKGEIFASGTEKAITMIESHLYEVKEKEVLVGLELLQKSFLTPIQLVEELLQKAGIKNQKEVAPQRDEQKDAIQKKY